VSKHTVLEVLHLLVDASLFLGQFLIGVAVVGEQTVLEVDGLIDFPLIGSRHEIVVGRHGCRVVDIAAHEHEFAQAGRDVAIFHPKHRVLRVGASKVVVAPLEHWAEGGDGGSEGGRVLVVISRHLDVEEFHLFRRNVGIVDAHHVAFRLIEDVVAVHNVAHLHLVFGREVFVAVELIVIRLEFPSQQHFEDEGEEVLPAIGLRGRRVIKHGVGVLGEVEREINVASPRSVVGHCRRRWEIAVGRTLGRCCGAFPLLCLSGASACWRLCHCRGGCEAE